MDVRSNMDQVPVYQVNTKYYQGVPFCQILALGISEKGQYKIMSISPKMGKHSFFGKLRQKAARKTLKFILIEISIDKLNQSHQLPKLGIAIELFGEGPIRPPGVNDPENISNAKSMGSKKPQFYNPTYDLQPFIWALKAGSSSLDNNYGR